MVVFATVCQERDAREPEREEISPIAVVRFIFTVASHPERVFRFPERVAIFPIAVASTAFVLAREPEREAISRVF